MSCNKDTIRSPMAKLKGKGTSSTLPMVSAKFHANSDQLTEFHITEDEPSDTSSTDNSNGSLEYCSQEQTAQTSSSSFKILPSLTKRSTSEDIPAANVDGHTDKTDPWRFFTDIKGKFSKNIDQKASSEPKNKRQVGDDDDSGLDADSKKAASEIDDTVNLQQHSSDSPENKNPHNQTANNMNSNDNNDGLRYRFRLWRSPSKEPHQRTGTTTTTNTISLDRNSVISMYNITVEDPNELIMEKESNTVHETEDIESGIDALVEDASDRKNLLKILTDKYENLCVEKGDDEAPPPTTTTTTTNVDDDRRNHRNNATKSVFSPYGYWDFRQQQQQSDYSFLQWNHRVLKGALLCPLLVWLVLYAPGVAVGLVIGGLTTYVYCLFRYLQQQQKFGAVTAGGGTASLLLPPIDECQPPVKYEGWLNELPDSYVPATYHLGRTQSVRMRLQGNLLRISHPHHSHRRIPKRLTWSDAPIGGGGQGEGEHHQQPITFALHRVYNLIGAKVVLLPFGLHPLRLWSRRYPICVVLPDGADSLRKPPRKNKAKKLSKDDLHLLSLDAFDNGGVDKIQQEHSNEIVPLSTSSPASFEFPVNFRNDDDNANNSSKLDKTAYTTAVDDNDDDDDDKENSDDAKSLPADWCSPSYSSQRDETSKDTTKLFLFTRSDREKEIWYRRLVQASLPRPNQEEPQTDIEDYSANFLSLLKKLHIQQMAAASNTNSSTEAAATVSTSPPPPSPKSAEEITQTLNSVQNEPSSLNDLKQSSSPLWVNAFLGRILYDCLRNAVFTQFVKERIERILAAIKLPYFIDELLVTDLNLGEQAPFVRHIGEPNVDSDHGLWLDVDLDYDGVAIMTLQTKLNLMKLKQQSHHHRRSSDPYQSDVSSASSSYSSAEDEPTTEPCTSPPPPPPPRHQHHRSRNFIKIVDRIAESRFFQKASEYRYVRRAIEGVSKTDLRLTVELRALNGTLVVNIPAPPSDRIWIGFRPVPTLTLSARPVVGERNLSFLMITGWIERRLRQEFEKLMVVPNMEDIYVPLMCSKLPNN